MDKVKIYLDEYEADALYKTGLNNECPGGVFYPQKKVWWIIENPDGSLPYTLCQSCYHNNEFGEKDATIKPTLKPVLMKGMHCCCDGITSNDAFPFVINGNRIGIYETKPHVGLLKGIITNGNHIICLTNEKKMTYFISLNLGGEFLNDHDELICKCYENEKEYTAAFTVSKSQAQDAHIQIDIVGIEENKKLLQNKYRNEQVTRRFKLTSNDVLLSDFTLTIKDIDMADVDILETINDLTVEI
jgi:hypothetical protein